MAQRRIFQASREEVSDLPVRGLSPANVAGGQYRVAVQQAPESGYTKLARSLSNVSAGLQAYASVADIQRQEGERQGQIDAAKADLEIAQQELDVAGQKLVDQGLMPKSHLLGYQRAYQENIGKRFVRSYMTNVNNRWNEVIDPEADDSVIDKILAQEREKIIQNFNKSPTALLGFTKNADAFDYQYVNKAVTARDKSVRQHNKSLIVEDLNNQYSGKWLDKDVSPAVTAQAMKGSVDKLIAAGSISKSEAVEAIWNSIAMPTVLAIASDNPDRAEQVLDAFLDIDLTGKGGRLGNINREGAWVKSRAVELRNRIDVERERIQRDAPDLSENILQDYTGAVSYVLDGLRAPVPRKDPFAGAGPDVENFSPETLEAVQEVTRVLIASGMQADEAGSEAILILEERDTNRLFERMRSGYIQNERTRGAFLDVVPNMNNTIINITEKGNYVIPDDEAESLVNDYKDVLKSDPTAKANEFITAYGIRDPKVKQAIRDVQYNVERQNWYPNTEEHKTRLQWVSATLKTTLGEMQPSGGALASISGLTEREKRQQYLTDAYITEQEQMYTEEMRKASQLTTDKEAFKKDESDGDKKHRELLDKIKTNYKEYFELRSQELQSSREKIGDRFDSVEPLTKKDNDTQKKFEAAIKEELQIAPVFNPKELLPFGFLTSKERLTDLGQLQKNLKNTGSRVDAFAYLKGLEQLNKDGKITKEAADLYNDYMEMMRKTYGYSDISEVPKNSKLPLTVPYWSNQDSVKRYIQRASQQLESYEEQNHTIEELDRYPNLIELFTKLNIPPDRDILTQFYKTQMKLLEQKE
jgi:hypothetical protein